MASGTSAAEEEPIEREKHRWSENSKVYTRKIHKGNKNNPNSSIASLPLSASATATANNQANENNDSNNPSSSSNDHNKNSDQIVNGSTAHEDGNEIEKEKEGAQQKSSSSPAAVPVEEANSSQPPVISARLETASEDSSILNRVDAPVPNGHDANLVNGSVKPLVTRVDDRVNISVSAASSKEVVRELKRKLVDELSQVRKMAKILEDKEAQLSAFSSSGIDVGAGEIDAGTNAPAAVSNLQFPANGEVEKGVGGGLRKNIDVGSNGSRLFRQLSVSVLENNHGVGEVIEKEKRTPKANQYYRNSEFLLGKEKLPPAESHKKSKSSSKKHRSREIDYGFGIDKQLYKKCSNLLQKLMRHKLGWVFNQPVDVKKLGLHDYFDIIKHPMDLGTVKTRLSKNWYKTPREFAEDVRLTFHNAMTYNPEGQDVHFMAKELLSIFEERWPAIETEYDRKLRYEVIRDIGVPTPTSRKSSSHVHAPLPLPPPPLLHQPPPFQEVRHLGRSKSMPVPPESRSMPAYQVGRTPAPKKPKAKDPHKRDMTFEEKQRLSTNLQSLPAEKLDAIVQIIKKRNTALSQHDDEIEVDIDSVDTETLWELDRFVTNYKKNLSKHKRKAELARARALAAQAAQETITAPVNVEAAKETREGEVNVATSPHVQQERHSDNASGSSSSSSSSSDSGSSSSDSDSDSSSSSGSDADNNS